MVTILDMATIHSLLGLVGGTVPFLGFLLVFSDLLCPGRSDRGERCVGCLFSQCSGLGSHLLLCWLAPAVVGQHRCDQTTLVLLLNFESEAF